MVLFIRPIHLHYGDGIGVRIHCMYDFQRFHDDFLEHTNFMNNLTWDDYVRFCTV